MTSLLDKPKRRPFEGVDRQQAGRLGGKERWRKAKLEKELEPLRRQDALEQKIFDGGNAAAQEALLKRWEQRNRKLERARIEADELVRRLTSEADALEQTIANLHAQCDKEREQLMELLTEGDKRRRDIVRLKERAASSIDDTMLVELLRDVGERRTQAACIACGWIDGEDVDAVA